jgi:hypothetical protein
VFRKKEKHNRPVFGRYALSGFSAPGSEDPVPLRIGAFFFCFVKRGAKPKTLNPLQGEIHSYEALSI